MEKVAAERQEPPDKTFCGRRKRGKEREKGTEEEVFESIICPFASSSLPLREREKE